MADGGDGGQEGEDGDRGGDDPVLLFARLPGAVRVSSLTGAGVGDLKARVMDELRRAGPGACGGDGGGLGGGGKEAEAGGVGGSGSGSGSTAGGGGGGGR